MALKGTQLDSAISQLQLAQVGSGSATGSLTACFGAQAIGAEFDAQVASVDNNGATPGMNA